MPQLSFVPRLKVFRIGDLMSAHGLVLRGMVGLMAYLDAVLSFEAKYMGVLSKLADPNVIMAVFTNRTFEVPMTSGEKVRGVT